MDTPLAPTGIKCRALWIAGKGIVEMPEDVALRRKRVCHIDFFNDFIK